MTDKNKPHLDPLKIFPEQRVGFTNPITLPDDMAAASLSALASATLSPDHPAADLKVMNDKLANLMLAEGDQSRTMLKQTQTLDAIFHYMIKQTLAPITEDGGNTADYNALALALKVQRQCADTLKNVNYADHMKQMGSYLNNKIPYIPPHQYEYYKKSPYATPTQNWEEQTEEGEEW